MKNIRIQSAVAHGGRQIIGRLLPGSDLMQGVAELCRGHNISCGIIVSIIGSLQRAEFIYPLPDRSNSIGVRYSDPMQIEGPIELLSCQGTIGLTDEGELNIHMHALISDPTMRVYGGHLVDNGNPVLGTGEFLIQECHDAKILRQHDEETGFSMFNFYSQGSQ